MTPKTPSRAERRSQRTPYKRKHEDSSYTTPPSSKRRAGSNTTPITSKPSSSAQQSVQDAGARINLNDKGAANPAYSKMYHFESSKSKPIDLTGSPPNGFRKTSFSQTRPSGFNLPQGPKKLTVKNLRTTPRHSPEEYLEKIWAQEDAALSASFNDDKIPYSLEELYKGAENVCRQGKAADLYKRLKQKCLRHINERVVESLKHIATSTESDVDVLKAFIDAWSKWQRQLLTIRQIFFYMDQTYLLRSPDNPNVTETGLVLFRDNVFEGEALKKRIMNGAVELVNTDRGGQKKNDDSDLLRKTIDTFHELTVYTSIYEPVLRDASEAYFRNWRASEAERSDLGYYASACTTILEQEMRRCDLLNLDRSTRAQISELYDTIFVEEKVDLLTEQEAVLGLLEADRSNELELVFRLLQRRQQGERLGATFDKYVNDHGTTIVFDEKNEADMVLNLLNFKHRLDHFWKFSFHNNDQMGNGLHKSFDAFMNKTKKSSSNWDTSNNKPGEMIAKHVDLLLKGGVKAVPKLVTSKDRGEDEHDFDDPGADEDAEINKHLSDALDLFRFVQGKAVFEAFYKKDLARRLLMGRSASNDAERNMLHRLKNECGASFTHNLESMFKDMDLARDEMASYNQLLDDRGTKQNPDLHVNVLSAAAWPTYPDVPVNIPPAIGKVMTDFEQHYKAKHTGRKLTWKNALAHCQLKAKFPRGNKEIVVSGFQAIVLLLFNELPTPDTSLSYKEIQKDTGLSDAELRRTLQSLACAKYRVLLKNPKGRDVNDTDTFTFNTTFSDPKMRIKINQIQLKETKEENKETHKRVAEDRHFETQAAIVRIMKSRKKISHNELIVEVIRATRSRGVLDQADIRKNIEKLIEKDYMEREGGNTYSYVA